MRAKLLVLLSVMVVVGTGCARGESSTGRSTDLPSETLLLSTPSGPLSVRSPAGQVVLGGAGAMASPDGSVIVSAATEGGSTVVSA
jgi:hypothetical protein